jgi:WS/DGAT/MGAT family acyltransferase
MGSFKRDAEGSMMAKPLHPVDAAWYHLDSRENPAVVTALALTRRPLDFAAVRERFLHRVARIDRFHSRVVETGLPWPTPHWVPAEDFDLDQHLHRVVLPAPGDDAALARLVEDLSNEPLPRELPLWQAHVIEGRANRGSGLLLRYHHCIGDGMAMMNLAERLFDHQAHPTAEPIDEEEIPVAPEPAPSMLQSAFSGFERSARELRQLAREAWDTATDPAAAMQAASLIARGAGALVQELLQPADPPSPFKGVFEMRQRIAWSRPLPIATFKAIGEPMNAKVNDVLVAALGGALRAYLKQRGGLPAQSSLRAMVPVNLRPPSHAHRMGNEFGVVILPLPIHETTPLRRLAAAKAQMDVLKHTPEAAAMHFLFDLFGRGPKPLEDLAQTWFGSKASLVLTNVAGPRKPMYLAGVAVDQMMFWVPHPGDEMGMGASILSYHRNAVLGLLCDARLVPDPESITAAFEHEVDTLQAQLKAGEARRAALRERASGRHHA